MQKFQDLNTKGKIEHIFYYYKWHIIISVLAVAFIVNIVQDIIHRDESLPLFVISLQGASAEHEKISDWEKEITSNIEKLEEDLNKNARVDFYSMDVENPDEYSSANLQKFVMMGMVGELDVVCLNEDFFMQQAKMGAYIPLESIPELSEILEINEANIIKVRAEEDTEEHIYGIKADNIKVFESIGYNSKGRIIGISRNTKKLPYIMQFLNLLFQ